MSRGGRAALIGTVVFRCLLVAASSETGQLCSLWFDRFFGSRLICVIRILYEFCVSTWEALISVGVIIRC